MGIKAAVFDYGGVISFPPPTETETELERLTGLPVETLRVLHRKHRGEWDRGTYSGIEYYRAILSDCGIFVDDASLARIVEADIEGWKHVNPLTVKLMLDIKAARLKLGILSNMPREFLSWVKANRLKLGGANITVFSCEHNVIKPEPAIYEKLRDQLDCDYSEILFFDDAAENIAQARVLGIRGILWDGPEAAREIIKNMEPEFITS